MNDMISARRLLVLGALAALCLVLMVHIEGCTLLGLAAGAAADAEHSHGGPALLLDIKVGRPVTLVLWNGRTLEGRFAGWTRDSAAAFDSTGMISPRGATVRLATEKGEIAVPAESIAKVSVSQHGGQMVGMLAGLAIDVMVIRSINQDLRPRASGCQESGSLPPFPN